MVQRQSMLNIIAFIDNQLERGNITPAEFFAVALAREELIADVREFDAQVEVPQAEAIEPTPELLLEQGKGE